MDISDKLLLNSKNMAETIIEHIKEFSSLNLSKHRSPINAFIQIITALVAYQLNPKKSLESIWLYLATQLKEKKIDTRKKSGVLS